MKTWVHVENEIVIAVMVCEDRPAGEGDWIEYPYPCDIAGAGSHGAINAAGMSLNEFDADGNLPIQEQEELV